MALTDYSTRFANFRKNPASLGARSIRKQIPTGPQNLAQALSGLGQEFFASKMESDAREKFEEDEGIRKGIENQVASILMSPNVASDVSRNQQVESIYRKAPFEDMQKEGLSRAVKRQDAEAAVRATDLASKKLAATKANRDSLLQQRNQWNETYPGKDFPPSLQSLPNYESSLSRGKLQPRQVSQSGNLEKELESVSSVNDIFNLTQKYAKMPSTEQQKSNIKEIVKRREKISKLTESDQLIDSVMSLYDNFDVKTGLGQETLAQIRSFGNTLGVSNIDMQKLASQEGFRSLGLQFVQAQIALTKGAVSDSEMRLFARGSINLGNTKQGNMLIAKMMKHANKAKLRLAQLETQMLENNVSENTRRILRQKMQVELKKENIWNDAERRLLTQAAGSKGKIPDRVGSTTTQQIGEEEVTIQEVSN